MIRPYRGKAINTGEWVKGDLIQWDNRRFIFFMPDYSNLQWLKDEIFNAETLIEVLPDSVGQYIDLKDKDGVEIYEGDIYKIFDETKENKIYEILFKEGCFLAQSLDGMKYHARTWAGDSCKIIGNITDSPNLLESPK